MEGGTVKRAWRWPLAGFVLGGLVGATILTVNVVGASRPDGPPVARAFGEILHTPPFLVRHDEPVKLTYGVVCGSRSDKPDPCTPKGSVFVRSSGESDFAELPLVADRNGELVASVLEKYLVGGGFDYYASIENGRGQSASLPAGAADAPQHAWIVPRWTEITLGPARFVDARAPSAIVARAAWGSGARELGLNSGREQSRIGPSAFDVAPDGSIIVLDQVNRRLAVYRNGGVSTHQPIEFSGGEGDLAVGRNGAIYVLDDGGTASSSPLVRSFDAGGTLLAGVRLAERTADMVRAGPNGPLVHGYPSEMWSPTGGGLPPLGPERQISLARPGRAVIGGLQVVVRALPNEARFALAGADGVVRSWRVKSSTPLGEVQLAEPDGDGLLVVLRRWTETRAEFRVLRLTPTGLAASFAVEPAEWAETASLSRFRLHGATLYQLRSSPAGVEIAAFQIGGTK
jgi:hypothetical protein